jgi:hypothetical protein
MFPFITKARSHPSNLLSGPLPKGNALLYGGGRGMGECGFIAHEGNIPCSDGGVAARLQVPSGVACG